MIKQEILLKLVLFFDANHIRFLNNNAQSIHGINTISISLDI